MRFAFFPGCKIPFYLNEYGQATRSVLAALDVRLEEMEFSCCGYPVRHLNFESFILSAARNLALAERKDLTILTPCKCCFGNLKHADHWMRERNGLREDVNGMLRKEGLEWTGTGQVRHLLSVLAEDVGLGPLKVRVKHPLNGLKVAVQYGCHALRPGNIVQFDNPLAPKMFENLISLTGAENVTGSRRLECCGAPLWEKNHDLSIELMKKKIADAGEAGADCLCTACTYCQIQFDTVQRTVRAEHNDGEPMPSILYPQLLGMSFGLPRAALGMEASHVPFPVTGGSSAF